MSATDKCFLNGVEVASLMERRLNHDCAVFQGEVWVAGGTTGYGEDSVEIYDPVMKTWKWGPNRPGGTENTRDFKPRLVENSGHLYYIGGDGIQKIYKLNENKNDWEEVFDVEKV